MNGLRKLVGNKAAQNSGIQIIIQEKELYKINYRLLSNQKIVKANELLLYSADLYPTSTFIRHLLAKSYMELGEIDKAKIAYEKDTIQIYNNFFCIRINLCCNCFYNWI